MSTATRDYWSCYQSAKVNVQSKLLAKLRRIKKVPKRSVRRIGMKGYERTLIPCHGYLTFNTIVYLTYHIISRLDYESDFSFSRCCRTAFSMLELEYPAEWQRLRQERYEWHCLEFTFKIVQMKKGYDVAYDTRKRLKDQLLAGI